MSEWGPRRPRPLLSITPGFSLDSGDPEYAADRLSIKTMDTVDGYTVAVSPEASRLTVLMDHHRSPKRVFKDGGFLGSVL